MATNTRSRYRQHRVAAAGLLTALLAWGPAAPAQAPAPPPDAAAEAAIRAHLDSVAAAFAKKDEAAIRRGFVENFAGPFRIPSLCRTVLTQVLTGAEQIVADFSVVATRVCGDRAWVIIELDLQLHLPGNAQKNAQGPYILGLEKAGDQWQIFAAEHLAVDWEVPPGAVSVKWEDEALAFAIPEGWQGYPLQAQEVRKQVLLVAPSLEAGITVAVYGLPVPVALQTLADQQKSVDQLFPGSRFLGVSETTLAGEPAVETQLDLKLGPKLTRGLALMSIRGNSLYTVSLAVTPSDKVQAYLPVFRQTCAGLKFTGTPSTVPPPAPPPAPGVANTYSDEAAGVAFTAPDGWAIQPVDAATVRKQGWIFAVNVKVAQTNGYVLIGARTLPQPVAPEGLKQLQQAEMNTIRGVAGDAKASDEAEVELGGLKGFSWVCVFTLGEPRQRREILAVRGNRLYFLVADAIPPSTYPVLAAGLDKLLATLRFATP